MRKQQILTYILLAVLLSACIVSIPFLPDEIPMHYDLNLQVNRIGSKYELLFVPFIALVFVILMEIIRKFRVAKEETNGKNNENIFMISSNLLLSILIVITIYQIVIAFINIEQPVVKAENFLQITFGCLGVLLIIIGNIMPKAKMNSVVGLKNKWTRSNETVWKKSQFFGGVCLMISGLAMVIINIFVSGIVCVIVSLSLLILATVISYIYSILISNKINKN